MRRATSSCDQPRTPRRRRSCCPTASSGVGTVSSVLPELCCTRLRVLHGTRLRLPTRPCTFMHCAHLNHMRQMLRTTGGCVTTLLLTPEQAAAELQIARRRIFEMIADGTLPSVKIGKSRRISRAALEEYVQGLETRKQPAAATA